MYVLAIYTIPVLKFVCYVCSELYKHTALMKSFSLVLYQPSAGVSTTGVAATLVMLDSNSIFPSSISSITDLVPAFVNTTDINTSSVISYTILNYQLQHFPPYNGAFLP